MSEQYRLVYSGEVLEGQHEAVVKKRLTALLKLDAARMDVLFSGKAVVVKKATDDKTAARYQEAFSKAGARLRVLPVEGSGEDAARAQEAPPAASQPAVQTATAEDAGDDSNLRVMPVGSDLLTDAERPPEVSAEVATDHISLSPLQAENTADTAVAASMPAPAVDHLTLAELGAQLGTSAAQEVVVAEIDADFDLAEVGVILGSLQAEPPPPPPDTNHLSLDDS